MHNKPKAFIFDCFDVICSPVLNGWYKNNCLEKGFIDNNLESIFREFDLGKISEEDILQYFLSYDVVNSTKEELRNDIDSYLRLDYHLCDIIKKLKNYGFKIILLSNANSAFFKRKIYTEFVNFKDLFDEIIISSEVGMIKPNKDIYLYTLDKINMQSKDVLFVDDSQKNIDGARVVGI